MKLKGVKKLYDLKLDKKIPGQGFAARALGKGGAASKPGISALTIGQLLEGVKEKPILSRKKAAQDAASRFLWVHVWQGLGEAAQDAASRSYGARDFLALDAASRRFMDDNGFLHVLDNPVSKAQAARYYGWEIPGWKEKGLEKNQFYTLLRPAEELAKAAPSINRLPIEFFHNATDAENLPKAQIIGSMGSDGRFDGVYLRNSLCFTDAGAIRLITGEGGMEPWRELSLSYYYDADMTPGEWGGAPYDGVMRNIRGNHLALVDKGAC